MSPLCQREEYRQIVEHRRRRHLPLSLNMVNTTGVVPSLPTEVNTYLDSRIELVPNIPEPVFDHDSQPPRRRTTVEDVTATEQGQSPRTYSQPFPSAHYAGAAFGSSRTSFNTIRDEQILNNTDIWGPFQNADEWELAKWLVKNVGHTQAESFLKLAMVSLINK